MASGDSADRGITVPQMTTDIACTKNENDVCMCVWDREERKSACKRSVQVECAGLSGLGLEVGAAWVLSLDAFSTRRNDQITTAVISYVGYL